MKLFLFLTALLTSCAALPDVRPGMHTRIASESSDEELTRRFYAPGVQVIKGSPTYRIYHTEMLRRRLISE